MNCKVCHPVFGHRLKQTGMPHPQSYECVACGELHTSDGEPSSSYVEPEVEVPVIECPACGSTDVSTSTYVCMCNKCGKVF